VQGAFDYYHRSVRGNGMRLCAEHQPQRLRGRRRCSDHFTALEHSVVLRLVVRTQPPSGGSVEMGPTLHPLTPQALHPQSGE
jgi:hypothetical protein